MRNNKKVRRKKKKMNLKVIALLVAVLLIAVGVTFIVKGCSSDVSYNNKETFETFAEKENKEINKENALGLEMSQDVKYQDGVSFATYLPKADNEFLDGSIKEYGDETEREISQFEREVYLMDEDKYERAAFVTGFKSFEGSNDTGSILITTERFEQLKSEKLEKKGQKIITLNFLKEKKTPLNFNNVFNSEKRDDLVSFLGEQLEKEHKDDLKSGYKEILAKDNLDKFILNGKNAEFFFDGNELVESGEAIRIAVSNGDVPELFREELKVRELDPTKPMVALTFDDGPDPSYTEQIVDMLDEHNAAGTFYLVGEKLQAVDTTDRILKKMIDNGHEIGTHSYDHSNLYTLTDKEVKAQNDKTDKILKDKAGIVATTYRPPFGNGNDKITKIFDKAGILWSVDTLDWKTRDKNSIVSEIKKVKNLNGHVILMHSIYDSSAKATKEILPWLEKEGYQLVTVSELLQYKYNVNPQEKKFYGYGYFHTVE